MLEQPTDAIRPSIRLRQSDLFSSSTGICEIPVRKSRASGNGTLRSVKNARRDLSDQQTRQSSSDRRTVTTPDRRPAANEWQSNPSNDSDHALGLFLKQALRTPLLSKSEERKLAQSIFRYRQAFQRLIAQEPRVIEYLTELLVQWDKKKIRLDAVCNLALCETSKRKKLEPKIRASLKTLKRLPKQIRSADSKAELRMIGRKTVKLFEELMIRPRPFETAPFENPKADQLLAEYHRLCQNMTRANLRLVVAVSKQLCGNSPVLMDMIQEGSRGLMHAVTKFDHRRNIRFSTYATPWIKQAIFAALPNSERNIRIPEGFGAKVRKLKRKMQDATERNSEWSHPDSGRNISRLANELNMAPRDVNRMLCVQRDTCSLNLAASAQSPSGTETGASLADLLVDDRELNPLQNAEEMEKKEVFRRLMNQSLDKRESDVISLRFGFADGKDRSLAEVGREMGITRERVRQVEKRAMEKLSQMQGQLEIV